MTDLSEYILLEQEGAKINAGSIFIYSLKKSSFLIKSNINKGLENIKCRVEFKILFPQSCDQSIPINCDILVNGVIATLPNSSIFHNDFISVQGFLNNGSLHIEILMHDYESLVVDEPFIIKDFFFPKPQEPDINELVNIIQIGYDLSLKIFTDDKNLLEKNLHAGKLVVEALTYKKPFSLIRIGDGEGRLLGHPIFFDDLDLLHQVISYQFGTHSIDKLKILFGRNWLRDACIDLQSKLTKAINNSDVLGLPVPNFYEDFKLKPEIGHYAYSVGLLALQVFKYRFNSSPVVAGTNVAQDIIVHGDSFSEILSAAQDVYLIGPWDLVDPFKIKYSIGNVKFIQVRPHATWGGLLNEGNYPLALYEAIAEINQVESTSGSLFLVGAGVVGKFLCNHIKSIGGVAMDVGSVFDSWAHKGIPYALDNDVKSLAGENA